jgi:hypothetical protein
MSDQSTKKEGIEPGDYVIYHEPIEVTYFLPLKRGKTCED